MMSVNYLISLLLVYTLVASLLVVYPLRSYAKSSCVLILFLSLLAVTGYFYWGSFTTWREYLHYKNRQIAAQNSLKSIHNTQELVDKLRAKLTEHPQSAKGWYLLGRLYSSQNKLQKALQAFEKAHALQPQVESFTLHYAYGLWQANQQQYTPEILKIFKRLLKKNPKQADALAMLALHAFQNHAYPQAIDYWQRLLVLAPERSEEALALRKAIAKASRLAHFIQK